MTAMRRPFLLIVVLTVSLFALMWGYGALVAPYSAGGWWGMGPGMMGGTGPWSGYGPGMRGFSPGAGPASSTGWRNLDLSADTVKIDMERWLAWQGNARLKVGDVKEKDADTIVADIVTKDNSLVQRFVVNRRSGFFQPSED
jgi:hypothetical protein